MRTKNSDVQGVDVLDIPDIPRKFRTLPRGGAVMVGKNPEEAIALKAFLQAEYDHYWDFLKYQYDVRDKYIQFFMLAFAALGALLGVVLEGDRNLQVASVIKLV